MSNIASLKLNTGKEHFSFNPNEVLPPTPSARKLDDVTGVLSSVDLLDKVGNGVYHVDQFIDAGVEGSTLTGTSGFVFSRRLKGGLVCHTYYAYSNDGNGGVEPIGIYQRFGGPSGDSIQFGPFKPCVNASSGVDYPVGLYANEKNFANGVSTLTSADPFSFGLPFPFAIGSENGIAFEFTVKSGSTGTVVYSIENYNDENHLILIKADTATSTITIEDQGGVICSGTFPFDESIQIMLSINDREDHSGLLSASARKSNGKGVSILASGRGSHIHEGGAFDLYDGLLGTDVSATVELAFFGKDFKAGYGIGVGERVVLAPAQASQFEIDNAASVHYPNNWSASQLKKFVEKYAPASSSGSEYPMGLYTNENNVAGNVSTLTSANNYSISMSVPFSFGWGGSLAFEFEVKAGSTGVVTYRVEGWNNNGVIDIKADTAAATITVSDESGLICSGALPFDERLQVGLEISDSSSGFGTLRASVRKPNGSGSFVQVAGGTSPHVYDAGTFDFYDGIEGTGVSATVEWALFGKDFKVMSNTGMGDKMILTPPPAGQYEVDNAATKHDPAVWSPSLIKKLVEQYAPSPDGAAPIQNSTFNFFDSYSTQYSVGNDFEVKVDTIHDNCTDATQSSIALRSNRVLPSNAYFEVNAFTPNFEVVLYPVKEGWTLYQNCIRLSFNGAGQLFLLKGSNSTSHYEFGGAVPVNTNVFSGESLSQGVGVSLGLGQNPDEVQLSLENIATGTIVNTTISFGDSGFLDWFGWDFSVLSYNRGGAGKVLGFNFGRRPLKGTPQLGSVPAAQLPCPVNRTMISTFAGSKDAVPLSDLYFFGVGDYLIDYVGGQASLKIEIPSRLVDVFYGGLIVSGGVTSQVVFDNTVGFYVNTEDAAGVSQPRPAITSIVYVPSDGSMPVPQMATPAM